MGKNPRDFPAATSAEAVENFIENRIDPKIGAIDITFTSLEDRFSHKKKILTLILDAVIHDESQDQTIQMRKNTTVQTARGMIATLNAGLRQ